MTLTLCILGSIICLAILIIAVCKILQGRREARTLRTVIVFTGEGVPFDPEPHELVVERYWH